MTLLDRKQQLQDVIQKTLEEELNLTLTHHTVVTKLVDSMCSFFYDPATSVADVWSIEDVQSILPGTTDARARDALECMYDDLDANEGMTWSVLEDALNTAWMED